MSSDTARTGSARVYASEGASLIVYAFDGASGTLNRQSATTLPAVIQAGCRDVDRNRLYIASSNGGYAANFAESDEHYLSAFHIEATGRLTALGDATALPSRPVDITIDHNGAHILVAYNDPSAVTVHSIAADGALIPEYAALELQLLNYAHQVMVSPSDDFITVCCTGQIIDRSADPALFRGGIRAFAYADGVVGESLHAPSPNGGLNFSPRDLEFHPTLPLAYVSLERHHQLQVFGYDHGGLDEAPLFSKTTLFAEPSRAMQFTGTVRMHPGGHVVYVANRTLGAYRDGERKRLARGGDNIAVFSVDEDSGEPTLKQNIDSEGVMPRTMAIDPTGTYLIIANQFEVEAYDEDDFITVPQSLVVYLIAADGELTRVSKTELAAGSKPMIWMDVVPYE